MSKDTNTPVISIKDFIKEFPFIFSSLADQQPWDITHTIADIMPGMIATLGADYFIKDNIAIHHTATIEDGAILKGPLIISANCFIGAHAYLRCGVYLGESVTVGPGCEIKSSIIFSHSALAHFNFIGESIIGSHVNFEAGAVIANHFNERADKKINVYYEGRPIPTKSEKFGAFIGDGTKVGANAVLSPGTVLMPHSIVKRLELVDQSPLI